MTSGFLPHVGQFNPEQADYTTSRFLKAVMSPNTMCFSDNTENYLKSVYAIDTFTISDHPVSKSDASSSESPLKNFRNSFPFIYRFIFSIS